MGQLQLACFECDQQFPSLSVRAPYFLYQVCVAGSLGEGGKGLRAKGGISLGVFGKL